MNVSDLLNVELYNDNLKMLALGNALDEGVLESLYERQVRKSTLMKNAFTLY